MEADRARGAVVVLRAKSGNELPSWLEAKDASERLSDGSFVVPAGLHRIGDLHYAVRCIVESISGDLSFHSDPRGVRWLRYGPIASKPMVEMKVPGFGLLTGYELAYEQCVAAHGVWVPLANITARRAAISKEQETAAARELNRAAVETPGAVEHRNVVVVRNAPKVLNKDIVVLAKLPDGTVLGVGPRNRGWVDWLKQHVPLEGLRLLRGPVSDAFLKEMLSFEMLDAACRLQGQPLLVMKPS